jgi:hypothetical protein
MRFNKARDASLSWFVCVDVADMYRQYDRAILHELFKTVPLHKCSSGIVLNNTSGIQ